MCPKPSHKDYFGLIRKQIEHEDSLHNSRTIWLLTLNGFLFTSYAFTLNGEATSLISQNNPLIDGFTSNLMNIRCAIASVGFLCSLAIFVSNIAASLSLTKLAKAWECKHPENKEHYPKVIGDGAFVFIGGMLPTIVIPMVFVASWWIVQPGLIKTLFISVPLILIFIGLTICLLVNKRAIPEEMARSMLSRFPFKYIAWACRKPKESSPKT